MVPLMLEEEDHQRGGRGVEAEEDHQLGGRGGRGRGRGRGASRLAALLNV